MAAQNYDNLSNEAFIAELLNPDADFTSEEQTPAGGTGESVTMPRLGRAPIQQNVEDDASLRANGMWNWTPEKIADWSIKSEGKFAPKQFATAHPTFVQNNPDVRQKLADAHGILADRGILDKVGDIDWVEAASGLGHMVKGVVKAGDAYSEQFGRRGTIGVPVISNVQAGIRAAADAKTSGKGNVIARALEAALPRSIFKKLFTDDPEAQSQVNEFLGTVDKEQLKKEAEIIAGSETAATGFIDMLRRGGRNVASMANVIDKWGELSPEERAKRFDMDTAVQEQLAKSVKGEGGVTEAVFGGQAKDVVDPQNVESFAAGDPTSLIGMGWMFRAVPGTLGYALSKTPAARQIARAATAANTAGVARNAAANAGRMASAEEAAAGRAAVGAFEAGTPEAIAQAEAAATSAAQLGRSARIATAVEARTAGQAAAAEAAIGPTARAARGVNSAIGSLLDRSSRAADAIGRGAGRGAVGAAAYGAGAATGAASGVVDFVSSFVPPIALPRAVRRGIELGYRGSRALRRTGSALARQQPKELGYFGQFLSDVTASIGETGVAAAKGLPFDVALGGLIADDPSEMRGIPLFMTAIGGLRGLGRGVRRTVGGQLVSERSARMQGPEFQAGARRNSGTFPSLDQANQFSLRGQPPEVIQRFGAIRAFVEQFGGEAFFVSDPVVARDALMATGMSEAAATRAAGQMGATVPITDANGNVRNVVLVNELRAGPHEGGHVLEMTMPAEQVEFLRREARRNYGRVWEQDGVRYTQDLLGRDLRPGESWRQALAEFVGADEARLNGRTMDEFADDYLADEYIAENIDAAVKSRGPGLGSSRIQDWVAQALIKLGAGDMVLGQSDVQGVDVTARSFETARNAGRLTSREINRPRFGGEGEPLRRGAPIRPEDVEPTDTGGEPPTAPTEPEPPRAPGRGPRTEDSVTTARDIATRLRNNGQRREAAIMDEVADAIANDEGVLVDYQSAAGTGAADPVVLRNIRRAEVELGRLPGAIRNQIRHMLYPFRVVNTSRGPQVIGWSPSVYVANAQRMASMLADLSHRGVDVRSLSPYEVDVRNRTFTEAGWNQFIADAEAFSRNQLAGATGAGEQLVVPRSAENMGAFAPEVRPERVGTEQPLPQNVADFHNMMFNFRLPDTPRMSRRGGAPLNIIGQEVSAATQPGRLSVPVEPRGQYLGERARELGIEGRDIMETNPLRAEIESAARDHGLNFPSMIETVQRLNLEHIADTTPAPGTAGYGRGNTLTLSAGFQAKRRGAGGKQFEALSEPPRVGYGKHVWIDKDGSFFDTGGFHKPWAEEFTGLKGDEAMSRMLNDGWVRANATPGMGIFVETGPGSALNKMQIGALESFANKAKLPVLNRKGRVQIESTAGWATDGTVFFQAKKRKGGTKDFALKKPSAGDRMTKAWILPNGEPAQLGGEWHHQYLGRMSSDLADRFGMDPRALKGGETVSRVEALKKGAVRINYNTGTGNLVIEATKDGWKRNKASLEMFAMENIDKIDSVDISIFDKNVTKEVDSDSAKLFRYDGVEKMENFPMLFDEMRNSAVGGAREKIGGMFSAQPTREGVESIKAAAIRWRPTGEVFEGVMHALATDSALNKGIADEYLGTRVRSFDELGEGDTWRRFMDQVDNGYVTDQGRFVSRAEAVDIGDKAGQLDNRAKAKIQMREEKFGVKGVDSMEISTLREQQMAAEAGGEISGETIGRAHGDPTMQAQAKPLNKDLFAELQKFQQRAEEATDPVAAEGYKSIVRAIRKEIDKDSAAGSTADMAAARRAQLEGRVADAGQRNSRIGTLLENMRKGESDGVTIDAAGNEVTKYNGEPWDVVTLSSENLPLGSAKAKQVSAVIDKWKGLLSHPDTTAGLFKFNDGNQDMVSVDINALVPQKFRENTLDFLRKNDQIGGFDLQNFTVFESGGKGQNPAIKTPAEAVQALGPLQRGEPVPMPKSDAGVSFQPRKEASEKPIEGVQLFDETIDPARPTAKGKNKRPESGEHMLTLADKFDDGNSKSVRDYAAKVVDKVGEIPGMRHFVGTAKERYEKMTRHIADNLKHLYEISPKAERDRHAMWYWIANAMSNKWGKKYGYETRAVAAANASLSPQKDWIENVSMTKHILDTLQSDPVVNATHADYTASIVGKRTQAGPFKQGQETVARIRENEGKKLSEVPDDVAAAVLRAEADLNTKRSLIDPDGNSVAKTETGRKGFSWGGYGTIENAVSILRNPALENISARLGGNHKVRSFYNNHINPQDRISQSVTVDTHATAAGAMIPFGASSTEVKFVFGGLKNAETGYAGTFPLFADAYRMAAKELGVSNPAELQSIVWERVRRITTPAQKRALQSLSKVNGVKTIRFPKVEEIWARYERGEITADQARLSIQELLAEKPEPKKSAKNREAARNQLSFNLDKRN